MPTEEIQVPTCGRIVHYCGGTKESGEAKVSAAMVNHDGNQDASCDLTVFTSQGPVVMLAVPWSKEYGTGCWSWMPFQRARQAAGQNQSQSAEPNTVAPKG